MKHLIIINELEIFNISDPCSLISFSAVLILLLMNNLLLPPSKISNNKIIHQDQCANMVTVIMLKAGFPLVDCPTQLICTWIFMTKLKEHNREIC